MYLSSVLCGIERSRTLANSSPPRTVWFSLQYPEKAFCVLLPRKLLSIFITTVAIVVRNQSEQSWIRVTRGDRRVHKDDVRFSIPRSTRTEVTIYIATTIKALQEPSDGVHISWDMRNFLSLLCECPTGVAHTILWHNEEIFRSNQSDRLGSRTNTRDPIFRNSAHPFLFPSNSSARTPARTLGIGENAAGPVNKVEDTVN